MSLNINVDITRLIEKLDYSSEVVIQEADVFVTQAANVGIEAAKARLDEAITPYGLKRFDEGQGRSPGRNDKGTMMDSIKELDPEVTSTSASLSFGWAEEDFENYFEAQEYGYYGIEAAHSLLDGQIAVEAELPRLAKNMRDRIRRKI